MPALVYPEAFEEEKVGRKQFKVQRPCDIFVLPEICDTIARFLDNRTLTVVVRVSSAWYELWIRHIWKRTRMETGTKMGFNMLKPFPRLSKHIRQLEWIHLSDDLISVNSIIHSVDMSELNLQYLLLSNWSSPVDSETLSNLVDSSSNRLSILQLHNMSGIKGDLLRVAGSLSKLRYLSLSMASQDSSSKHRRHRSNGLTSSNPSAELVAHSPNGHFAVIDEVTSKAEFVQEWTNTDSLPELLDNCPQLRTIELTDLPSGVAASSPMDRNEHIPAQWKPLLHLTIIKLTNTTISGSTLSILFQRCPQLVKFNLSQDTPLYLSNFHIDSTTTMGALSNLALSKCHLLDGHGFKELFNASPNLHVLDISYTNVDDTGLGALGRQCSQLKELNMDGCQQITDQGIRDMLSYGPSKDSTTLTHNSAAQSTLYQNYNLRHLSVSECTEITGQGIQHILMTCGRLNSLDVQQPELHPESLFPHSLQSDDGDNTVEELSISTPQSTNDHPSDTTVQLSEGEGGNEAEDDSNAEGSALPWACHTTLEVLRIRNLNFINQGQSRFLNSRLRELSQLKVLHIGGSQLELSILNGLGHQIENLYIDDLAREVNLDDVRWFVDHTPNLTRLWCRQLVRHSEPWKLLREAKKHMKMW